MYGSITPEETAEALERVAWHCEREEYAKFHSMEKRKQLASEGKALSDGSYPIEDAGDLGPALTLIKSGHGDVGGATALFKKRAKELGRSDMIKELEGDSSGK